MEELIIAEGDIKKALQIMAYTAGNESPLLGALAKLNELEERDKKLSDPNKIIQKYSNDLKATPLGKYTKLNVDDILDASRKAVEEKNKTSDKQTEPYDHTILMLRLLYISWKLNIHELELPQGPRIKLRDIKELTLIATNTIFPESRQPRPWK